MSSMIRRRTPAARQARRAARAAKAAGTPLVPGWRDRTARALRLAGLGPALAAVVVPALRARHAPAPRGWAAVEA